jgi:hypothetical protein
MRFDGFIGPSYQLRSVNVDCQRCINLYPEFDETGHAKEQEVAALIGTPGLSLLATVGTGPIRGTWRATNGVLFVVSGNTLYSVTNTWVATNRGTLLTTSGTVSMADNGIQLMIVDGPYGYYLTLATNAFAQILDPGFPGADMVAYQDGYFIINKPNTGIFQNSGLNDITFSALNFATSEGNPDNINAVISNSRDLWVFNDYTVEVFFNAGNPTGSPFSRMQGAFIEHGCAAKFSVAKMNNTVYWIGRDADGQGVVYAAKGYQPQKISTSAVDFAIQGYGDISDAVAYTYQESGHYFYCLNFSLANTTWVYDASTQMWHERAYNNSGVLERHRGNNHAFAYSTHILGDYQNGNIYKLSSTIYSDNGAPITRRRVSPHLTAGLKRIFYSSFQLDIESGTGIDGLGQGVDPQAMIEFSDDGGHSWSNERWTSFGRIGQTRARAIWRKLGRARDRVWRLTITDPVKVVLIGAEIDLAPGDN